MEIQVGRHDERIKNLEEWVPKLQFSVDTLNATTAKMPTKIIGILSAVYIVIQTIVIFAQGFFN